MRELTSLESRAVTGGLKKQTGGGNYGSGGSGGSTSGGGSGAGGGGGGGYQFGVSTPGSGGSGAGTGNLLGEGNLILNNNNSQYSALMSALGQMGLGSGLECGASLMWAAGSDGISLAASGVSATWTCAEFATSPLGQLAQEYAPYYDNGVAGLTLTTSQLFLDYIEKFW